MLLFFVYSPLTNTCDELNQTILPPLGEPGLLWGAEDRPEPQLQVSRRGDALAGEARSCVCEAREFNDDVIRKTNGHALCVIVQSGIQMAAVDEGLWVVVRNCGLVGDV